SGLSAAGARIGARLTLSMGRLLRLRGFLAGLLNDALDQVGIVHGSLFLAPGPSPRSADPLVSIFQLIAAVLSAAATYFSYRKQAKTIVSTLYFFAYPANNAILLSN